MTGCHSCQHDAPEHHAAGDIFGGREDLEEPVVQGEGNKVAKIVDGAEPSVLRGGEVGVSEDAHHRCVGKPVLLGLNNAMSLGNEHSFVHILKHVQAA